MGIEYQVLSPAGWHFTGQPESGRVFSMSTAARIRRNPEGTEFEIITPEDVEFESDIDPDEADPDYLVVMAEDGDPNKYLAVVGPYPGLEENTVYRLVKVDTVLEELDDDPDDQVTT